MIIRASLYYVILPAWSFRAGLLGWLTWTFHNTNANLLYTDNVQGWSRLHSLFPENCAAHSLIFGPMVGFESALVCRVWATSSFVHHPPYIHPRAYPNSTKGSVKLSNWMNAEYSGSLPFPALIFCNRKASATHSTSVQIYLRAKLKNVPQSLPRLIVYRTKTRCRGFWKLFSEQIKLPALRWSSGSGVRPLNT